uniref:Uncharacterized protein n=1 Tax=Lepeophtheirus salmonis TaxID=72036 RepID=A0A0K2UNY9_LEPSM
MRLTRTTVFAELRDPERGRSAEAYKPLLIVDPNRSRLRFPGRTTLEIVVVRVVGLKRHQSPRLLRLRRMMKRTKKRMMKKRAYSKREAPLPSPQSKVFRRKCFSHRISRGVPQIEVFSWCC